MAGSAPASTLASFFGAKKALVQFDGAADGKGFGVWKCDKDGSGGKWVMRVGGRGCLFPLVTMYLADQLWMRVLLVSGIVGMIGGGRDISDSARMALVLVAVLILALGPGYAMRRFEEGYAFWSSTTTLLTKYGVVVGLARGADLGFMKELAAMREGGKLKYCLTADTLLQRTGLGEYVRSSVADLWRRWSYDEVFVGTMMAPVVDCMVAPNSAAAAGGKGAEEVNALAGCFEVMVCDWGNSDASKQYARVRGGNAKLCDALVHKVETKLETKVVGVSKVAGDGLGGWSVRFIDENGVRKEKIFDGVVLAARMSRDNDISLGLEKDDLDFAELLGDCAGEVGGSSGAVGRGNNAVEDESCYIAVVHGVLQPKFFGFSRELDVPDRIRTVRSSKLCFFERISSPNCEAADERGVYVVDCGKDFVTGGAMCEMFSVTDNADPKVLYFEPQAPLLNHLRPMSGLVGASVSDIVPFMVFGEKFVYAAATDRIARSPEFDAMIATNTASLFSSVVSWEGEKTSDGNPSDTDFPEDDIEPQEECPAVTANVPTH